MAPFFLTCGAPGILLGLFFAGRKEIRLLPFLLYAAVGGFSFQIAVSFAASLTASLPASPAARVTAISLVFTAALLMALLKRKEWPHIRLTAYDGASAAVILILLAVLRGRFAALATPYFNAASDQYYWLAYAEASLHDAAFVLSKIFTSQIHRPVFFFLLAPYTAFFPKNVATYQGLMMAWTYGIYTLIAVAIAELAHACLSRKMLGLMAAPMLFSLHWVNYYVISGSLAPQGLGIFLFITGFVFLLETPPLAMLWIFFGLFYAVHLGTLSVFGLIIGIATVLRRGLLQFQGVFLKNAGKAEPWHLFEKIFFLPTIIIIPLYALYASGALSYFSPSLINYYPQYEEHLTLFSQPYLGREQAILLWGGILGTILAFSRKKDVWAGTGFLVPWTLLMTPLVAYHAFYASWQSFRYYLFLYPAAVLLTLLIAERGADAIGRFASGRVAKSIVFALVVGMLPIWILAAAQQGRMVFLDMIEGRDDGALSKEQYANLEKLLSVTALLPEGSRRPIAVHPANALSTYVQWAAAPRETVIFRNPCTEISCPAENTLLPDMTDIWKADPAMLFVAKNAQGVAIDRKIMEKFIPVSETEDFLIYRKP